MQSVAPRRRCHSPFPARPLQLVTRRESNAPVGLADVGTRSATVLEGLTPSLSSTAATEEWASPVFSDDDLAAAVVARKPMDPILAMMMQASRGFEVQMKDRGDLLHGQHPNAEAHGAETGIVPSSRHHTGSLARD